VAEEEEEEEGSDEGVVGAGAEVAFATSTIGGTVLEEAPVDMT
jgi:hypothetical protein